MTSKGFHKATNHNISVDTYQTCNSLVIGQILLRLLNPFPNNRKVKIQPFYYIKIPIKFVINCSWFLYCRCETAGKPRFSLKEIKNWLWHPRKGLQVWWENQIIHEWWFFMFDSIENNLIVLWSNWSNKKRNQDVWTDCETWGSFDRPDVISFGLKNWIIYLFEFWLKFNDIIHRHVSKLQLTKSGEQNIQWH